MRLKELKRKDAETLTLLWIDGHQGPVSLRSLRDACPCAGCQGESVLLKTYTPPDRDTSGVGRYVLLSAVPVGSYALKMSWQDGHDLGIYTWAYLRSLCECAECMAKRPLMKGGE